MARAILGATYGFTKQWKPRGPLSPCSRLPLLCSASGYVLREVQDFVFSLLSAKSLVVPQHIIGTGCGCRRDGRVADTDVGSRRQRIGATGQQLVETPAS